MWLTFVIGKLGNDTKKINRDKILLKAMKSCQIYMLSLVDNVTQSTNL